MNKEEMKEIEMPIKDKMNLTIKEASIYSNIGESNLRKLLKKRNCPFLLRDGINCYNFSPKWWQKWWQKNFSGGKNNTKNQMRKIE